MKKTLVFSLGALVLFVYAALNIFTSQNPSPLFFELATRANEKAAVSFLKIIKRERSFGEQLGYFTTRHGQAITDDVFEENVARADEIGKLEELLKKNPSSRDILLRLALLYAKEENISAAKDYYAKAKSIDPFVSVGEIEELITQFNRWSPTD